MICGIEIALAIYGLLALCRGQIKLGNRIVEGAAARWAGFLFMLPWPLSFVVGFGIGFNEASAGRRFILKDWQGFLIALELVALLICSLLGLMIVAAASPPQRRRERMTEDYERVLRNTGTGSAEPWAADRPSAPPLDEPPYVIPAQPIEAIQPQSMPVPAGLSAPPPQPQSNVKPARSTPWLLLAVVFGAVIVLGALAVGFLLMPQQQNSAFNTIGASIATTVGPSVVQQPDPAAPGDRPRRVPPIAVADPDDPPGLWRQFPVPDRLAEMALAADGAWLAVANEDQRIQVWHTAAGKQGPEFPSGTKEKPRLGAVPSVAVSPDGRWIASANPGDGVVLRELATGDQKALLATGDGGDGAAAAAVVALVFSPDSKRLAGTTGDQLHLWDIPGGAARQFGKGQLAHADARYAYLQFTADGKQLFTSGVMAGDQRLQEGLDAIWDVATAQLDVKPKFLPRQADVPTLLTPDGNWLARHGLVSVRRESPRPGVLSGPMSWQLRQVASTWAIARGIPLLAIGHVDGTVSLWDAEKGELLTTFAAGGKAPIQRVALAADARVLATGTSDRVRLWEVAKLLNGHAIAGLPRPLDAPEPKPPEVKPAEPPARVEEPPPVRPVEPLRPPPVGEKTAGSRRICPLPQEDVSGIALSPGGKVLATLTKEHIILWDTATAKEIARFEDPCIYAIRTVAFSPDGKWLINTAADGKAPVRVRDGTTGQEVSQIDHGGYLGFRPIVISPDSKTLALIGSLSVVLVDLATGERRSLTRGTRIGYKNAVFLDEGKQLRLAGTVGKGQGIDLIAQRVDAATGKELDSQVVRSGNSMPHPIMAPNGRLFAFAYSGAPRVTLLDLEALDSAPALSGKPMNADTAVFTPDSRRLATFGRDGKVILWDIEKSEAVQEWAFTMRQKRMASLAASPDGAALAVTTANGVMLCEVGKR